jgi:hypothetical protein
MNKKQNDATLLLKATTTHHAEGIVNPKVLAKKHVTDFRYPIQSKDNQR